jgi:ribonuclease PH
LHDALERVVQRGGLSANPLHSFCSAISVGIVAGTPVLDLPYVEDSIAEVDMNVVMLRPADGGEASFVEVQGTAEGMTFSRSQLDSLLGLAEGGLTTISDAQAGLVAEPPSARAAR